MEPLPPHPHPLSLGEILDEGFDLVRREAVLLLGLAAALYVPLAFLATPRAGTAVPPLPAIAAIGLIAALAGPVLGAAITAGCGAARHGARLTAGGVVRAGLARVLPLVGSYLLAGLVVLAPLAAVGVGALATGYSFTRMPSAEAALVFLVALLVSCIVALRFMLLPQVVVLEGVGGVPALRRASELVAGQTTRVAFVYLVIALLTSLLAGAVSLALETIPGIGPLATGGVQALAFVYSTAAGVVLYEDVRVRKGEGGGPSSPAVQQAAAR